MPPGCALLLLLRLRLVRIFSQAEDGIRDGHVTGVQTCALPISKKPIYDIPGFPEIDAGELVDNLMKQIEPFQPGFTLGERAETLEKQEDGSFIVTTNKGTKHHAPIVAIAGGDRKSVV